jgi:redox-sensitive bicupin YhaK (pirin superfamily)
VATSDNAIPINQDASVYVSNILEGREVCHSLPDKRGAWVHIIRGECSVNGTPLQGGDAAAIESPGEIVIQGLAKASDIILFDLA